MKTCSFFQHLVTYPLPTAILRINKNRVKRERQKSGERKTERWRGGDREKGLICELETPFQSCKKPTFGQMVHQLLKLPALFSRWLCSLPCGVHPSVSSSLPLHFLTETHTHTHTHARTQTNKQKQKTTHWQQQQTNKNKTTKTTKTRGLHRGKHDS